MIRLLSADVQDIPDGTSARIKIVEKDTDGNDDDVATLTAKVSGGKIECAWKVVYMEDDDDADSEQEKASRWMLWGGLSNNLKIKKQELYYQTQSIQFIYLMVEK